jgi:hypothetical protein
MKNEFWEKGMIFCLKMGEIIKNINKSQGAQFPYFPTPTCFFYSMLFWIFLASKLLIK